MDLIRESCPESSCSSLDVPCVAKGVVDNALCIARKLIESDPEGVFLYKRPVIDIFGFVEQVGSEHTSYESMTPKSSNRSSGTTGRVDSDTSYQHDRVEWSTIADFNINDVVNQIRDYVSLWQLTPATKCALITVKNVEQLPPKGTRYFVNALFSKPTPMCPNPLAVATVFFEINVSSVMPKNYPVMVTYRFEGHKTVFHVLGKRALRSLSFQRLYIDTILQMKLAFYAEICEYRHPSRKLAELESVVDMYTKMANSAADKDNNLKN